MNRVPCPVNPGAVPGLCVCVYVCCLSVCVLKFLAALIIQFRDLRPLGLKTLRVSGFEFLGVKFDFLNYIQILVENGRKKNAS